MMMTPPPSFEDGGQKWWPDFGSERNLWVVYVPFHPVVKSSVFWSNVAKLCTHVMHIGTCLLLFCLCLPWLLETTTNPGMFCVGILEGLMLKVNGSLSKIKCLKANVI